MAVHKKRKGILSLEDQYRGRIQEGCNHSRHTWLRKH
jgi:hypothetical protein